ncbi:MAG: tRNA (N(6)-L-threonylcarbamoyladenosine(37)-C(2))-methylthiotransferase MtaB [Candidatus Hydrogenedentota bacterium]
MKKVGLKSLGCKLNQSDTEIIANILSDNNYKIVPFDSLADIYIINTCTVTKEGDVSSRRAVNQAIKKNSNALIFVAGCYAETNPDDFKINGKRIINIGHKNKFNILRYLELPAHYKQDHRWTDVNIKNSFFTTRAFIKIQDGCNFNCSYCKARIARWKSESKPVDNIIKEINNLVSLGTKEVVLCGMNIGLYNHNNINLPQLLEIILDKSTISRVRLSSIDICDVTSDLIKIVKNNERICKHLHLPLQSASNKILKLMKRRYTIEKYNEVLQNIFANIKDVGIGADVMVGFPSETDYDWNKTLQFIEKNNFAYLHIFSYSDRAETDSYKLNDKVPKKLIKLRSKITRDFTKKIIEQYKKGFINREATILIENRHNNEKVSGLTSNYLRVYINPHHPDSHVATPDKILNTLQKVRIISYEYDKLWGIIPRHSDLQMAQNSAG